MNRYLCSRCDCFVSGSDLMPVTNYLSRKIRTDRVLVGQCICSGLVYEATDDDMLDHMEREIQARGLAV